MPGARSGPAASGVTATVNRSPFRRGQGPAGVVAVGAYWWVGGVGSPVHVQGMSGTHFRLPTRVTWKNCGKRKKIFICGELRKLRENRGKFWELGKVAENWKKKLRKLQEIAENLRISIAPTCGCPGAWRLPTAAADAGGPGWRVSSTGLNSRHSRRSFRLLTGKPLMAVTTSPGCTPHSLAGAHVSTMRASPARGTVFRKKITFETT